MEHTQPPNGHLTDECSHCAFLLVSSSGYGHSRDLPISRIFTLKNPLIGGHYDLSSTFTAFIISYDDDAASIYFAVHPPQNLNQTESLSPKMSFFLLSH